jgi:CHAD domain-containing protein/uncharacterized protein YjbK
MAAPHARELEAKFLLSPETHRALSEEPLVPDGIFTEEIGVAEQTDCYMDTRAYELLRHGLAFRIRSTATAQEAGIKSIQASRKDAIQDRMEIAILLPYSALPLDASQWPATLNDQLAHYAIKPEALRPLVVVRQKRQKNKLRNSLDALAFAEWSLDEVWIEQASGSVEVTPLASTEHGLANNHFYELELEFIPTTGSETQLEQSQQAFAQLVKDVQKQHGLTPVYPSKFVRGLQHSIDAAHGNHRELAPEMDLGAAGQYLLHQLMLQILLNEHGVRYSSSARYVHDMRVAIRRARSVLRLCHGALPKKAVEQLDKGLRRLGRSLGHVRDLDVTMSNLRAFRRSRPAGELQGLRALRNELRSRRAHAHSDLIALLDSRKHRKFIIETLEFCTSPLPPPLHGNGSSKRESRRVMPVQLRHTLPSRIMAAFEAVRAYEGALGGAQTPPLETIHALRLEAKHLRYLLEFSQHLLGPDVEKLINALRNFQEQLGELSDADVEHQRLAQWSQILRAEPSLSEAIHLRLGEVENDIQRMIAQIPAAHQELIRVEQRENVARGLAQL